jgi:hypothetical protein
MSSQILIHCPFTDRKVATLSESPGSESRGKSVGKPAQKEAASRIFIEVLFFFDILQPVAQIGEAS